ncbi:MAG: CcmD family protein [Nitrospirae bacterium]|nr:CcmD family protein [Nitrospirota bacterium]
MDNLFYLFGAYSAAWLGVTVYLLLNLGRLKKIESRIEDVDEFIRRLNR